jgi:endogenous inhibitor of DNA gyrase (YacG/DUF329 family)
MSPPRECVTCGQPFTVPANNPHKRFCSPRCRVADWHARNDHTTKSANGVPHAAAHPNAVPADVHSPNAVAANAAPTANSGQRCPHCHAPLAVIAIVVPPTAAHVRTPEPDHA